MAIVKMNYEEFADIESNIQKAYESLDAAEKCWGTNFDNLYNNIVASGWLDSLYSDAESNWHVWKGTITCVAAVAGFAVALATPVGWVAVAIAALGAIFGLGVGIKTIAKTPDWYTVSKEVFEQLLKDLMYGNDDCYIRIANLATKFYNIELNLEKIKSKVNDFNVSGADFKQAADTYGLSVKTGGADGTTIVGIETEIVIDGETIKMDTSEAMSALYTYAYTVTSSMIAADYLERTYGYEIDYLGLVTNANAFMADTIKSDLYTSEMINLLLPAVTPDEKAAYGAASAAIGLDESELKAALGDVSALGVNPLFAGLVGASFIGALSSGQTTGPTTGQTSSPTTGQTSSPTTGQTSSPTTGQTSSPTTGQTSSPTTGPTTAPTSPDTSVPFDPDKTEGNDVDITPPVELDIDKMEADLDVDYDKMAMEEYQFETGVEEIEKYRLQIMDEVDELYVSGEFTTLTKQLQDFGYNTAEISTILGSKAMTINAMLDGNTRQIVAAKAEGMAKADGVEGFKSSYSNKPSTDELGDNSKPLRSLHLNSDNQELCEMEAELDGLEADYRTKVDDANKLINEAEVNKQAVDAIKEKYEKEYGNDTSKWTEDAAKEYDAAIDKYNASAEAANKAVEEANVAKDSYDKTRSEFDKACEDYYKSKIISEEESNQIDDITGGLLYDNNTGMNSDDVFINMDGSVNIGDPVNSNSVSTDVTFNPDGSINLGETSNSNTNNSGSTASDVTFNPDGTINFGTSTSTVTNSSASSNTTTSDFGAVSNDSVLAALGLKTKDKDNN